jgi:hypothetical protein
MKLNSKVTGGLAWAGLVLVLAVPSADMLTKPSAKSATIRSGMDAIETASVSPVVKPVVKPGVPATREPVVTEAAAGTDVVDDYLSSGKKLPSYISDAPADVAQEPATTKPLVVPTTTMPLVVPKTTTAATPEVTAEGTFASDYKADVAAVAPKPYPASMRPAPTTATAALPANNEAPLIIDEEELAQREAAIRPVEPFVPVESEQIVTEDELEEWDSGSLAEYLERKGLISESGLAAERLSTQFDEDGFFLSEGPNNNNNSKAKRRRVNDDVDFFLF